MSNSRLSGVLLHPTSLPGRYGIGDLGGEAYRFVDFLAKTGQSVWQVLPLGPTGYGNSPYMCFSAFAGNPLLISLEDLVKKKLLDKSDIDSPPSFSNIRVDYMRVSRYKMPLLRKSFINFKNKHTVALYEDYQSIIRQNASWLEDYALFMSLKRENNNLSWPDWDERITHRESISIAEWKDRLDEDIQFHKYLQYIFITQWKSLKHYCCSKGIKIIGDMPIYVAHDSSDVWVNRDLFCLNEHGYPTVVAGVPPDYFSATGQRWGNPLYRWDIMEKAGYNWWIDRFRLNFELADILRLDHFRGFEAFWEIPAIEPTAIVGRWVKGPGAQLFEAVQACIGKIPVIAEDLGVITPEVDALRERFNFPGMAVLQMAFGTDQRATQYRPHNHIRHSVVYTATHDNNTTIGWFSAKPGTQCTQSKEEIIQERKYALKYTGSNGMEMNWDFIRLAMGSVADTCIFPLQDVLGLGSEARMNFPGTSMGNWEWRFSFNQLTRGIVRRFNELTKTFERHQG